MAYGMDGFITPMMRYFAAEGCLPNFSRFSKRVPSTRTYPHSQSGRPPTWATFSTGAHTGTHSVPTWQTAIARKAKGAEKDIVVNSFDGRANNAERIWNALERAGLKGVAVHYPGAHPSGVEIGYVVDGFGHPATTIQTSKWPPLKPIHRTPLRPATLPWATTARQWPVPVASSPSLL